MVVFTCNEILPMTVGVLPSSSPRGIPRTVVMSSDSPRSERDDVRNTSI